MYRIVEFLINPWVQMLCWVAAAAMVFRLLKDAAPYWYLLSTGIFLYGLRVAFKLMPFYNETVLWPQVIRYTLGLIGGFFIMISIIDYYYSELKPVIEVL